jgi:hypothetical protein
VAEVREERTTNLGLLALMLAAADSQEWGYPYWNQIWIDAVLAGLAGGDRTGVSRPIAPSTGPTLDLVTSGGQIPAGIDYDVVQTFVDEYGRETDAGTVGEKNTGTPIDDPDTVLTIGTPTSEASGFEGGLLEVWYSWTDDQGGETYPSDGAEIELPYLSGLYNQVTVTLPATPASVGADGANIYIRFRNGNVVLATSITDDSETDALLDGTVDDCYRSLPLSNTTFATRVIQITGITGGSGNYENAVYTRFYIRLKDSDWYTGDHRLKTGGVSEWAADYGSYPLEYTGLIAELIPGYPPPVTLVQALKPIELDTEVYGNLPVGMLPSEATTEDELVLTQGESILSGFVVTANSPADMAVDVATGEALLAAGRFTPDAVDDLVIPTADPTNDRIDIICIADDGTIEGPTENASLKGTPAGTPSPPSTPSGYLIIAEIYVTASDTEIATGDITDMRLLLTTLVDETAARIAEDASIDQDLTDHIDDEDAHASKPDAFGQQNESCGGSTTENFTIACTIDCLITSVKLVATTSGTLDYDFEFFTDSGRTILAYKAEGIDAASWEDRIPWEWFAAGTFYARITNNSADAITNLAVDVKYRR